MRIMFLIVACVVVWSLGLYSATFFEELLPPLLAQRITKTNTQRFTCLTQISGKSLSIKGLATWPQASAMLSCMRQQLQVTRKKLRKSSPHSAPIGPTQGASKNTSAPSIQIPLQFLSCISTNLTGIITKLCNT